MGRVYGEERISGKMSEYKRLTKQKWSNEIDLTQELGYSYIYKRLYELENLLDNELLVELPCKVGDTVYMIWVDKLDENNAPIHKIQSGNIFAIQLESQEGNLDIWLRVEFGLTYCCRRINDFYLTRAEAEAKLKELTEGARNEK